jgi:hypothetical protein
VFRSTPGRWLRTRTSLSRFDPRTRTEGDGLLFPVCLDDALKRTDEAWAVKLRRIGETARGDHDPHYLKACTKADIPDDLTFHDVRGSAVTAGQRPGARFPKSQPSQGTRSRVEASLTRISPQDHEARRVRGRRAGARRGGDGNRWRTKIGKQSNRSRCRQG